MPWCGYKTLDSELFFVSADLLLADEYTQFMNPELCQSANVVTLGSAEELHGVRRLRKGHEALLSQGRKQTS